MFYIGLYIVCNVEKSGKSFHIGLYREKVKKIFFS